MKRLLCITMLVASLFTINGCAGISTTPGTSTAITDSENAATQTLYAIGTALQATPGIVDALYNAGKITKSDYNNITTIYNQALGAYNLAEAALKDAINAGQDPSTVVNYTNAITTFLSDKTMLDNLVMAFNGQPIGTVSSGRK